MKEMLNYYRFESLAEFGKAYGFYNEKDAERFLKEIYEEDTIA